MIQGFSALRAFTPGYPIAAPSALPSPLNSRRVLGALLAIFLPRLRRYRRATSHAPSHSFTAAPSTLTKYLLDLVRCDDLELRIRTIARLLVRSPTAKLRRVPKPIALHVLVRNLHH